MKWKNTLGGINGRLYIAEEKNSEFEDKKKKKKDNDSKWNTGQKENLKTNRASVSCGELPSSLI